MGKFIDLTGQKFNSLRVVQRVGTSKDGQALWQCQCDCENVSLVDGKSLRTGNTKSCGCSRKKPRPSRVKHGDCGTRLYRIWGNMKHRCYGKSDVEKYQYYGGRGISVCIEWHEYNNFKKWALVSGYTESLTLDRTNNDGNYEPSNCKWASVQEQCMNRRSNNFITENDETLSIYQWMAKLKVSYKTITERLKYGGSVYGR